MIARLVRLVRVGYLHNHASRAVDLDILLLNNAASTVDLDILAFTLTGHGGGTHID